MRISRGADDRLLMFVFALLICGCLVQPSKDGDTPKPGKQTLEQIAFESFQKRDLVRADLIDEAIKDIEEDRLKYDGPCMDRLAKIGAEASETTWKPAAVVAQSVMVGERWEKQKAIKVFKSIRDASRRAGK